MTHAHPDHPGSAAHLSKASASVSMHGTTLDFADGIEVVHTPGHTPGHVSLLLKRDGGVLFVGDAASNVLGLGYSLGYDDLEAGKASLARLAGLEFEVALFGHGRPIMSGASERFSNEFA